jgi:rSAM/selenodomain-associated transferase 2
MAAMSRVSVVIPLRNESVEVGRTIAAWWNPAEAELIVAGADGGAATNVLREAGASVLCETGATRGARLAHAAHLARGSILLFLHGDSRPPGRVLELVVEAVDAGATAGAFSLSYDEPDLALRWTAWWANVRSRVLRLPFGDQGLFCTREAYEQAGGFRDMPVCDDVDIVRRLKRAGRFVILPERIVTSARSYRRGAARQTFRVWSTLIGYFVGIEPARLARWYFRDGGPHSRSQRERRPP